MGGVHRFAVLVSSLCGATSMVAAAPAPGAEISIADLGWPTATIGAVARHHVRVVDATEHGKPIALVQAGTRLTWRRIVAGDHACRAWLALEPRGWACASEVTPTDKPATNDAPPMLREQWADIRGTGADVFDTPDAIKTGAPTKHVGDKTFVAMRGAGVTVIDGVRYYKTDQGWIAGSSLAWYEPSPFTGIELAPRAALDFAWAVAHRPGGKIDVRDAASAKAKVVRKLQPRERVTIAEIAEGFARVGDAEWVELGELRWPERVQRPDGVMAGERWIDVDLDQQWLVAYEGDAPVFVTLVSTGRVPRLANADRHLPDPRQGSVARMQDPGGLAETWDVADVPWSMRFRRNFALHGTYWHDGFGRMRSHGCVNLSPADAKRLRNWVSPNAPAGWTEVEADLGIGTPVRIHDKRDPDPTWRDYEGRVSENKVKTRRLPRPRSLVTSGYQRSPPRPPPRRRDHHATTASPSRHRHHRRHNHRRHRRRHRRRHSHRRHHHNRRRHDHRRHRRDSRHRRHRRHTHHRRRHRRGPGAARLR